tara:strand:- start:7532 stop:8488 length:957 start_codon:yes stop_codon:yes gene_type:complete
MSFIYNFFLKTFKNNTPNITKNIKKKSLKNFNIQKTVERKPEVYYDALKTKLKNPEEKNIVFLKNIGSGAHSNVFKTIDASNNLYVCKKIRKCFKNHALKEIIILNNLRNNDYFPNYRFYIENDKYVEIYTDYDDAIDLFEYINNLIINKGLENKMIKDIFLKMTKAVMEFHSQGFNHLDIKMENFIILNKTKQIKLIDFEMSNQYSEELRSIKRLVGTSGYSPIETYKRQYSYKTDIWSLGICLWILLTGNMPFNHAKLSFKNINPLDEVFFSILPSHTEKKNLDKDALDLILKILVLDVNKRITLNDIILHKWFNK